jgi:hypothetical protein
MLRAWAGIGWHDVACQSAAGYGALWPVMEGLARSPPCLAIWLPRLDKRGDGKLWRLLAIARGDKIHLLCVAIYWQTRHATTCTTMTDSSEACVVVTAFGRRCMLLFAGLNVDAVVRSSLPDGGFFP